MASQLLLPVSKEGYAAEQKEKVQNTNSIINAFVSYNFLNSLVHPEMQSIWSRIF